MKPTALFGCALALLLASAPQAARAADAPRPATNPPMPAPNALDFTEWELTSPTYAGAKVTPFLRFRDGNLGAGVGLNGMGGGYKLGGNTITIEPLISTMMAGPPALMDAENRLQNGDRGRADLPTIGRWPNPDAARHADSDLSAHRHHRAGFCGDRDQNHQRRARTWPRIGRRQDGQIPSVGRFGGKSAGAVSPKPK